MEKSKLELKDTADLMTSKDHGDRLLAEFMQLDIRVKGLKVMLDKWDQAYREGRDIEEALGFEPTTPFEVLYEQLVHMKSYRRVLLHRMYIEGVPMDNYEEEKEWKNS